jgi:hypothetical protein
MQESLLNFCRWLQNTSVGLAVSGTSWGYPYVQLVHFFGLSMWVGTIAMLDLRLLGLVARRYTASELAYQLTPLTWTGLGIAVTGGFLLFSANASMYFQNFAFRTKIPLVLTGIAYHVLIQRNARKWGASLSTPPVAKLAGLSELALWLGVITMAAEIPNF